MKKVTVLLILSLAICLAACGKKVSTPDEMLDVVKEKENISAEVDMIECGSPCWMRWMLMNQTRYQEVVWSEQKAGLWTITVRMKNRCVGILSQR